jgi:hypothetical protein
MAVLESTNGMEGAIWGRLLHPNNAPLSVEAARSLLRLDFPPEDKQRMHELAMKAQEGTLSAPEEEEVRNYERVGNLLSLLRSKARQRLKKRTTSNGSGR